MPRKRTDILTNLQSKGFALDEGDHYFLIYVRTDGKKSPIRTKMSRGTSHKDISDINLAQMARQVRLTKGQFLELVDCPMDRVQYEANAKP
jgi:hypothetical protein